MDDPIATRTGRRKPRSFCGCHRRTEQASRVSDRSSIAFVTEEWNHDSRADGARDAVLILWCRTPNHRATRTATRPPPWARSSLWLKPPTSLPTTPHDHTSHCTLETLLGFVGAGRRFRSGVLTNSKPAYFRLPGTQGELGPSVDPARDRYEANNSDGLRRTQVSETATAVSPLIISSMSANGRLCGSLRVENAPEDLH